jgi:F0F1-type ATP synthase membrane subunit b/b'
MLHFIHINEAFWVACSFIIFAFLCYLFFRKPVLKALDNKIDGIAYVISNSEKILKETEDEVLKMRESFVQIQKDRVQILADAKSSGEQIIMDSQQETKKIINEMRDNNHQKINEIALSYKGRLYKACVDKIFDDLKKVVEQNRSAFDPLKFINDVKINK